MDNHRIRNINGYDEYDEYALGYGKLVASAQMESLKSLKKFIKETADKMESCLALRRIAGIMRMRGKYESSVRIFGKVLQRYPDLQEQCAIVLRETGSIYSMLGLHETALKHYLTIPAEYPGQRWKCARAFRYCGVDLRSRKKYNEALSYFNRIIREFPDQPWQCAWAYTELGFTFGLMGNYSGAENAYTTVLNLYSFLPAHAGRALVGYGNLKRGNGDPEGAVSIYASVNKEYGQQREECALACIETGIAFVYARDYDTAEQMFYKTIQSYGDIPDQCATALLEAAKIHIRKGLLHKAVPVLEEVLKSYSGFTAAIDAIIWLKLIKSSRLEKTGTIYTGGLGTKTGFTPAYVCRKWWSMALSGIPVHDSLKIEQTAFHRKKNRMIETDTGFWIGDSMNKPVDPGTAINRTLPQFRHVFLEMVKFRALHDEKWRIFDLEAANGM
jgi:tetratricopeptide (TPR) repeat protein